MLRLPALLLSATLSLSATAGSVVPMTQEMYQMFGIIITNCVRTTRGIKVDFWTAHEPPYFVGVYPTMDWLEGGYIAEVATSVGSAFIPGDYTDLPVYVEAITPARITQLDNYSGTGTSLHSKLTSEQVAFYRSICNPLPKASVDHIVKTRGSPAVPLNYYQVTFPRYYGIEYNGVSVSYPSAQTVVSFHKIPVRGSAVGEENIRYWTQTSYTGDTYNPHSNNLWCLWSTNIIPQHMMYRDGPMYSISHSRSGGANPVVTNTIEELYDMARAGVKTVTYDIGGILTSSITLERGTLFNTRGSSYTPVSASWAMVASWDYCLGPVTNTMETVEYTNGWVLRPFNYSTNALASELLWVDDHHDTNTSNRIFLPGLFKNIDNNGPIRTAQRDLGDFIIVTNTPSHWQTDLGIAETAPVSNNLFKIHYHPGDEPSPALIERTIFP